MGDQMIDCPVEVPTDRGVVVANAFRIVPDTGDEYFLDFMVYSPANQRAEVVARVRVHEDCLVSIRDRLDSELREVIDSRLMVVLSPPSNEVN